MKMGELRPQNFNGSNRIENRKKTAKQTIKNCPSSFKNGGRKKSYA